MSTKKLQILNSIMKQAENADTLDGKHADDFATATDVEQLKSLVGDESVSDQINSALSNLEDISITTDSELDTTSDNPIQNKVVAENIEVIKQQIADLMYEAITITSFTNNINTVENGATVTNVALTWKTSKTPTALTLDDEIIDASSTSKELSGLSISSNKAWILKATDERNAVATKTTSITFLNGVYYGVIDSDATINSSLINDLVAQNQLTKKLSSSPSVRFTATANEGQVFFFALPASYKTPDFKDAETNLAAGMYLSETISFTNATNNHIELYNIWLSEQSGLGEVTIIVSEVA